MKEIDVLIRKFYALEVEAHAAHINTRSYAQHIALGDFYDKVSDFKDRLIEYLTGEKKLAKVNVSMIEVGSDISKSADELAEMFCDFAEKAGDEALINMSGEFEEAVGKLKYLFMLA